MSYEEVRSESSKYNEAALQIMRLNNLWVRLEDNFNKGYLEKVKYLLDSVWRELRPDAERQENGELIKKKNTLLRRKIAICKTDNLLYEALSERYEFLKCMQDSCGKGSVYKDDNELDFE